MLRATKRIIAYRELKPQVHKGFNQSLTKLPDIWRQHGGLVDEGIEKCSKGLSKLYK